MAKDYTKDDDYRLVKSLYGQISLADISLQTGVGLWRVKQMVEVIKCEVAATDGEDDYAATTQDVINYLVDKSLKISVLGYGRYEVDGRIVNAQNLIERAYDLGWRKKW